ncbi:phosphoenolpyruvate phosphomutase [Streptococcus pneumoniae]|nr:phosphoenolpyruvate phosphomutase [Streptococcus pneumoniae]
MVIHALNSRLDDLYQALKYFKRYFPEIPLIVIPTDFPYVCAEELFESGADLIIYANHLLRSIIRPMEYIAKSILIDGYSNGVENKLLPISEILNYIPLLEEIDEK